jgi:hypothetical protein
MDRTGLIGSSHTRIVKQSEIKERAILQRMALKLAVTDSAESLITSRRTEGRSMKVFIQKLLNKY